MKRRAKVGGTEYAQELIDRFGAQMLATARRYSSTDEDAEDAYQRAAEIALVHRPTGERDDLLRWLRTTTKHEALSIRRHRSRVIAVGAPESVPEPHDAGDPHQRAERLEQLRHGGEALRRLKPQEVRALQLRAEGYSYKEICEITGWSYTKVNRCLAEGRQAFLRNLGQIESGAECERLAHHLSALADGEATSADLEALRPHLATCLACRARLREYRSAPARVAALVPVTALAADPIVASVRPPLETLDVAATSPAHPLRSLYDTIAGATHDRWTALAAATQERMVAAGDRLHQATELATAQKAAAVAASAVALTGGAVAGERAERDPAVAPKIERQVASPPAAALAPSAFAQARRLPPPRDGAPGPTTGGSAAPSARTGPALAGGASAEFGPEPPSPAPSAGPQPLPAPSAGPQPTEDRPAVSPSTPEPPTAAGSAEPGAFER